MYIEVVKCIGFMRLDFNQNMVDYQMKRTKTQFNVQVQHHQYDNPSGEDMDFFAIAIRL